MARRYCPVLALGATALAAALLAPATAAAGAPSATPRAVCRAGQVSLTFDDGPAPGVTPRLVRILRDRHVPATFFMNGTKVAAAPRVARRVERSGFLVANHGYDHADMTALSEESIVSTIRRTDAQLRRAGTHPVPLLRPPYGAVDAEVYAGARRTRHAVVLWDVDPADWDHRSSAQIADSVLAQLRPRGRNIVLLHDGVVNSPRTVDAVPRIVRTARRRGYCFVALDTSGQPGFPTPTATLSVDRDHRRVREGRRMRATVTLPYPAGRETSVRLSVTSETGRVRDDLRLRSKVLTIPAGATAVRVRIPVRRDGLDEQTERFTLSVAVEDRDPPPTVSGEPVAVVEPAAGTTQVPVTFRLSEASGREVRLAFRTVPGTAGTMDYIATSGTVVVPPGATSVKVGVTVYADLLPEGPETFAVHLDRATHAKVRVRDAVVTINDPV
jgi:peptidoglycan/xylan/chitin deacetylase (PgdA/CDA1 family)